MNSTSTAKTSSLIPRAHQQIVRIAEQLTKAGRNPARLAGARSSLLPVRRRGLSALVGMPLAACVGIAALVLQSSHRGEAKPVVTASQLVPTASSPPDILLLAAQPARSAVQVVPAEATRVQATLLAEAAKQEAAPAAGEPVPDQVQLLQTIARSLAKVERELEELKASQEEMKRELAKVSEQNPPKAATPPAQSAPSPQKSERTAPRERARPKGRRDDWYYSDWW